MPFPNFPNRCGICGKDKRIKKRIKSVGICLDCADNEALLSKFDLYIREYEPSYAQSVSKKTLKRSGR